MSCQVYKRSKQAINSHSFCIISSSLKGRRVVLRKSYEELAPLYGRSNLTLWTSEVWMVLPIRRRWVFGSFSTISKGPANLLNGSLLYLCAGNPSFVWLMPYTFFSDNWRWILAIVLVVLTKISLWYAPLEHGTYKLERNIASIHYKKILITNQIFLVSLNIKIGHKGPLVTRTWVVTFRH